MFDSSDCPTNEEVTAAVGEALARREELHRRSDLTGYRLVHGAADALPGLTVDRIDDLAVIEVRGERDRFDLPSLAAQLIEHAPVTRVAIRGARAEQRGPHPAPLENLIGDAPTDPIWIDEGGLKFQVAPNERRANGFFYDARPAREWLREHSSDRRITNLFAHTGSLGVAALAGGARSVVHVDAKSSPLDVARLHHRENGLEVDNRSFLRGNVYQVLKRAGRGGVQVDGVILDPPPVVPRKLAPRPPVGQDFEQLTSLAAPMLAPGAWLLCFFSREDVSREESEAAVERGAGMPLEVIWRGTSGVDFPAQGEERQLRLTAWRKES